MGQRTSQSALHTGRCAHPEGDNPFETYRRFIETKGAENAANTLICVIHQANYLLDQLLRRLARDFRDDGGFSEKLYRMRQERLKQLMSDGASNGSA